MDQDDTRTHEPAGERRDRIGRYRVLEKLGEGGMGEVWLAEQTEPLRRKVAVKVIRRGLDTEHIIARFEAERQALALMNHPSIAKIYDAGATEDGRPYFVMEYVAGEPVTEYCDGRTLGIRERLLLFVKICAGVQHAHQKAVIHRDIKPSNVLVADVDGEPCPKIIDFGIAKALTQPLTDKTLHTEFGTVVGTLAYMSPEQAEGGHDVDTRSDVYSLGVLLYWLLVGALPLDLEVLRRARADALRRELREADIVRPSRRLATLEPSDSATSARCRGTDPSTLRHQLSGDLDWIATKALEFDRSRRYGSPHELAEDIERHLDDRPVVARPPTLAYRASKFSRRHRTGLAVAAAGLALIATVPVARSLFLAQLAREQERTMDEALSSAGMVDRADPDAPALGRIDFTVDLDEFAPLGKGSGNAALWFAAFARSGERAREFDSAIARARTGADEPGWAPNRLLPDDPLVREAESQVDLASMRFYPDVWKPAAAGSPTPNLLMMLLLARAWGARADATPDLSRAIEDYRRMLRLGRLVRQEDATVVADLVGLEIVREGLEALGKRLRAAGDEHGADKVLLALCQVTTQRLASLQRRNQIEFDRYVSVTWLGPRLDLPDWKLNAVTEIATKDENRRFRAEAAKTLCAVARYGSRGQRSRAREVLDRIAQSPDSLLSAAAACADDPTQ